MRTVTVYLNDVVLITMPVNKDCSNAAVYEYLVSEGYSSKIVIAG